MDAQSDLDTNVAAVKDGPTERADAVSADAGHAAATLDQAERNQAEGDQAERNQTPGAILLSSIIAAVGLMTFGVGVYLAIHANIGLGPWDTLASGVAQTLGITFGTATIGISILVLLIDCAMREQIGIGMLLDSIIVGKTVDLMEWIDWLPMFDNYLLGIGIMLLALFIDGFAQFLYMRVALGCGPRDTMLVGLSRRIPKVPIGVISICIMAVVTLVGWLLGGSVGLGTVIFAFLAGPIMQLDFAVVKFEPTKVKHQNLIVSFRVFKRALTGRE